MKITFAIFLILALLSFSFIECKSRYHGSHGKRYHGNRHGGYNRGARYSHGGRYRHSGRYRHGGRHSGRHGGRRG